MKLILLAVFTLFLFSGCAERSVYIDSKCPKLQTYDVNKTIKVYYNVE